MTKAIEPDKKVTKLDYSSYDDRVLKLNFKFYTRSTSCIKFDTYHKKYNFLSMSVFKELNTPFDSLKMRHEFSKKNHSFSYNTLYVDNDEKITTEMPIRSYSMPLKSISEYDDYIYEYDDEDND